MRAASSVTTLLLIAGGAALNTCPGVEQDTNYEGADLKHKKVSSADECCDACNAENQCKYWTFQKGTCYMKTGQGKASKRSGDISGSTGASPAPPAPMPPPSPMPLPPHAMPCDIYGNASTPCVSAHSTVRALYAEYRGPLYQLQRSDGSKQDIMVNDAGYADSAEQDSFCSGKTCVIQRIYDQSPMGNHLDPSPASPAHYGKHGKPRWEPGTPVDAMKHPIVINGHPVYGAWFEMGDGYRNDKTKGVVKGNEEESMYMVTSGKHYNDQCCFDYGNAETDNLDDGDGTMEAIYFGNASWQGNRGAGKGPWIGADLENGMYYGGNVSAPSNKPLTHEYVTAMLKGRTDSMVIKGGDATAGKLQTMYDGPHPPPAHAGVKPGKGYQPMKKQGAIILGIGGDNARAAIGTFYEGVMTKGLSTDAADDAVQANIASAGYGSTAFAMV